MPINARWKGQFRAAPVDPEHLAGPGVSHGEGPPAGGIAGVAIEIAKIIFFVAIVLFVIAVVAGLLGRRSSATPLP